MNFSPRAAIQQRVTDHVGNIDADAFYNLLTGPTLLHRVKDLQPSHRVRVFSPTETLALFMTQALSSDSSCRRAVDDAAVQRLVDGLPPPSPNTSAYCQARARLPLPMLSTLARDVGDLVTAGAARWWHWQGRRVCLVDGTTVTLADTPANQTRYPQSNSQQVGLGFPIARWVALLCLASGALLDAALGPCSGKGGDEQSLLRSLLATLQRGDILLGDAYYATYFLLGELRHRGVDGLFEQYGARRRSTDFSSGQRLGVRDHLIVLTKPKKPDWMSREEYERAPATLTVREFQAGGKLMVTTLRCPKQTPKGILKVLYHRRWNAELDLRHIKTTLGMERLRCKTPPMALKELWVYLLAYNLIRLLMAQAALLADQIPRQLSFKHTVQLWLSWQQRGSRTHDGASIRALMILIAAPRVGLRPSRIEPRALKRRPKSYPLLTKPRAMAQAEVRQNGHPKKQR